jgi:hypothetical protein
LIKKNGRYIRCCTCGKLIYRSGYYLKTNKNHYCSVLCSNNDLAKKEKGRRRFGVTVKCGFCGESVYRPKSEIKERGKYYCSRKCSNSDPEKREVLSQKMVGRKHSEGTINKLKRYTKEKSSGWKGGKPKCEICKKEIGYESKRCNKCKMIGKGVISEVHRQKISDSLVGKMPKNVGKCGEWLNIKRGWYDINGKKMYFRSKWEANYALYLDFLMGHQKIIKWEYESETFIFNKIKFGTRSYTPDFKVYELDKSVSYTEVKGFMTARSKTQLKRMKKYFPKVRLRVVDRSCYFAVKKQLEKLINFYQ